MNSFTVICLTSPFVLKGIGYILSLCSILMENPVSKQYRPYQKSHYMYVASDLGLHCLPMTFMEFQVKTG